MQSLTGSLPPRSVCLTRVFPGAAVAAARVSFRAGVYRAGGGTLVPVAVDAGLAARYAAAAVLRRAIGVARGGAAA